MQVALRLAEAGTRTAGSVKDVTWKDVAVGQLLVVRDEELFPADLLCLHSELPERVCFIKTTNLDGETNLKHRRPLDLKKEGPQGQQVLPAVHLVLCLHGHLVLCLHGPSPTQAPGCLAGLAARWQRAQGVVSYSPSCRALWSWRAG